MDDARSDWLGALGDRAGPLAEAARRFLGSHPGAPSLPVGPGVEGLGRLATAIDAWAEREDEVAHLDDEAFVEGAGALLGCLLLARFPDGAHAAREGAHRVRLGANGFFDPFRAVESALEGPEAHAVLLEELARADDEAAGRTGIGRAVRVLRERLAAMRPEVDVRDHFEQLVGLGEGVELDLSRVLTATEGEGEDAVARAVDKLLAMLPGTTGPAGTTWEEARAIVLPRPVPAGFVDPLRGDLAIRSVLGGELRVALILGYPDRARYVRAQEITQWGLSWEQALAAALTNLAQRSAAARFARVDTEHGPLVVARTGDGLDGARLLLPALHPVLAPELGSPFLAAAPHRDALWACALEPAPLRAALAARVREDAARAPHRIDEGLFVVGPGGLSRRYAA